MGVKKTHTEILERGSSNLNSEQSITTRPLESCLLKQSGMVCLLAKFEGHRIKFLQELGRYI